MEDGYRTNYFCTNDDAWGKDLPLCLKADENLDADIEKIGNAIRALVFAAGDAPLGSFNITLFGPMDGLSRTPRPTAEEALAASKSQGDRFDTLGDAAKSRFEAGDFEAARAHALELQKMILSYVDNPFYGSAVASVNIVLGRLAMKDGNVEGAEAFLIEAGRSPGSPTMDTFGPNMSLAQDLLIAGHSKAVLEYFKLCAKFWSSKFSKLEKWTEDVNAGRLPDFGANLEY